MDSDKRLKIIETILNKVNLKLIAAQFLELCVMIIFTVLAVSYANYKFEIPFFPRDTDGANMIEIPVSRNTENAVTTETPTEVPDYINILNADNPMAESAQSGEQNQNSEHVFESLADLEALGFAVTDDMYTPYNEAEINRRKAEIRQIKAEILAAAAEAAENEVNENGKESDLSGVPVLYEYKFAKITPEHIPANLLQAVESVMDYLLILDGDKKILCNASGKIIDANFGASEIEIMNMRDSEGRTLFRKRVIVDTAAGPVIQVDYYIYNADLHAYEIIEYDDGVWGNRGAPFMYPSSYGMPDNNLMIFKDTKNLWGYYSILTDKNVISAQYTKAFNFSENIGAAYKEIWADNSQIGRRLYFHDETGKVVNSDYFAPDPVDEETNHLGFYYFDHGLTRVIRKRVNNARGDSTTEQRGILIDKNWREFYTPEDYTIRAYSNGMILLEKDGNYGFMNYLGEWLGVAQPIYTYAEPFYEGVAVIGMKDGKKMLIDTKGNIIANKQYDYISNCTGGIIALYDRESGWTILNKVRRAIDAE